MRLPAVPARGLVAAPRRCDRHHGQQNRLEDLDDLRASTYRAVVSVVVTELVGHLRGRDRFRHLARVAPPAACGFIPTGRCGYGTRD